MIDQAVVRVGSTVVYVVSLAILLAWLRRVPEDRRDLCYPVVLVVGVATAAAGLGMFDLGIVVVNGTEVVVPTLIDDLLAYTLLWVVAARLADIEGRMLAFVAAIPVVQRLAFEVAAISGGLLALVGVVVVVGGHLALGGVFFGPIWRRAQSIPEQRRLLHWKARNLLLFLIGMLIVYAVLSLFGIFDAFVQSTINQYMSILIRVGFAGFLFANLDAVGDTSLRPSSATADRTDATPAD